MHSVFSGAQGVGAGVEMNPRTQARARLPLTRALLASAHRQRGMKSLVDGSQVKASGVQRSNGVHRVVIEKPSRGLGEPPPRGQVAFPSLPTVATRPGNLDGCEHTACPVTVL